MNEITIAFLEDDTLFAGSLQEFLEDAGFSVTHAATGQKLLDITFAGHFDLYLLDINLPDCQGSSLLKELRGAGDDTPAIFLTSYKDKEMLQQAFVCGGDDYIKKPVDLDELLLRIEAVLKRSGRLSAERITLCEGVVYDTQKQLIFQDNRQLQLPSKVLGLLDLFLDNKGVIVTKEMISSRLWDGEDFSEGSLRVYVNKLKKLLPEGSIENIKGVGYRFAEGT
ncbi:MAG: response regulator transcription factor [Campylobacterota bacterium]